jgi:hypothetical protein
MVTTVSEDARLFIEVVDGNSVHKTEPLADVYLAAG